MVRVSRQPLRFTTQFQHYYPNFTLRSSIRRHHHHHHQHRRTTTRTTTAAAIAVRRVPAAAAAVVLPPVVINKKAPTLVKAGKAVSFTLVPAVAAAGASKAVAGAGGWVNHGNMSEDPESGMFRYAPKLQPDSPEPNLEICFSFDTTGSMATYITQVKEKVAEITRQLLGDLPNIRISIIAHGDYCDHRNYVLKKLDLSNDLDAIPHFINGVGQTGGGDGDECYELVLMEAQSLSWSPTSAKDAAPHKPHEYRRIDWNIELEKLRALGVKVYGVRCGNVAEKFYETIAQETGGATLELRDIKGISEMMMGLCYREAAAEHGRRRDAMMAVEAAANVENNHNNNNAGAGVRGKGRGKEKGKGKETDVVMMEDREAEADGDADGDGDGDVMRGPEFSEEEKAEGLVNKFDEVAAMAIHKAIHSPGKRSVKVHGKTHEISVGYAGCKFVKIGDETYIEQNKDKSSRYAKMAVEGRKITWIIRKGKWGLIMDENRKIEQTDAQVDNA
jgi:hypothetical protein